VHGCGVRALRDIQDRRLVQVALGGWRWPETVRLVRIGNVLRVRIAVRVHGYRAYPQPLARPYDSHRDLASIGDQDAFDHILNTPNRVGAISALSAAEMPSARAMRVSTGSITPSSHRRAVE
jgi:hypothetical protein